jgi:hypothetical protein
VCFCDQDWYASILPNCRVDGSDLTMPFNCPIDVLLNPGNLDASPLPYRMASYLSDIRTPSKFKTSQEPVVMDTSHAWIHFRRNRNDGAGSYVATGQWATDIAQDLQGMQMVHVLNFEGLRPGAFGGFDTLEESSQFDRIFAAIIGQEAQWCCR